MKFEKTSEHLYWWPINIRMPDGDRSGQWKTETFEMQFVAVPEDEIRRIQEVYNALATAAERVDHEHDQLLAAARDWRGVHDGEKQPVPFSRDTLVAVLRAAVWYRNGIYESYQKSLVSNEPRLKN